MREGHKKLVALEKTQAEMPATITSMTKQRKRAGGSAATTRLCIASQNVLKKNRKEKRRKGTK